MLQIQICLTLLILGASGGSPFSQAPQRSESEYSMRIQLPDGQYGCSDWFLGIEGHEHEYFDPFLGVNNPGIRVTRVLNGYPAQRMGLRPGDVVTSMTVNGRDYTRFRRMGDLVRALSVSRDGIAVVRIVPLSRGPLTDAHENVDEKRVQMVRRPFRLEQDADEPSFP